MRIVNGGPLLVVHLDTVSKVRVKDNALKPYFMALNAAIKSGWIKEPGYVWIRLEVQDDDTHVYTVRPY